jgi:heme exporter protein C
MIYRLYSAFSFLVMTAALYLAFIISPPAKGLGELARILYLHVPLAWVGTLSFLISGIGAVLFLVTRKKTTLILMETAAGLGMLFIILTTITGSIWAKVSWGSFWNWDPRETSMAMILFIYLSFFLLKKYGGKPGARAAYLIIAAIIMPFFIFVIPRIYPSLHPDTIINSEKKMHLSGSMLAALLSSIAAYTLYYAQIFFVTFKIHTLRLKD